MKKVSIIYVVLLLAMVFVGASNGQTNNSSNSSEKQKDKNEQQAKDQPVKIKSKPTAGKADCSQSSGIVTLRVTFDKSEKVTNVETVSSSGCDSFDRNAIKAAKEIKFKPAVKSGEPVTVFKQVKYSFRKY